MLRSVRRRWRGMRGEALACFTLRVVAVSPYPEEPEGVEGYTPTLLVDSAPEPGDETAALEPGALAIGALLFVEWAQSRLGEATLPLRLRAVLPRLRIAVEEGRVLEGLGHGGELLSYEVPTYFGMLCAAYGQ